MLYQYFNQLLMTIKSPTFFCECQKALKTINRKQKNIRQNTKKAEWQKSVIATIRNNNRGGGGGGGG